MDPNERHGEPLHDASDQAGQRIVQLIALTVTIRQMLAQRQMRREQRARLREDEQRRAAEERARLEHAEARTRWAPAYDKSWLAEADILQTARVWGAAVPFADFDTAAAGAVQRCEERLRHLHPAAMRHYDALRRDGLDPVEAMAQTAPRFSGHADPYTNGPAAQRRVIARAPSDLIAEHEGLRLIHYPDGLRPSGADFQRERDRKAAGNIADRLQAEAAANDQPALRHEEVRTLLDTRTNLPEEVIADITPKAKRVTLHSTPHNTAALAAEDFPLDMRAVLEAPTEHLHQPPTTLRPPGNTRTQRPHLGQ